MKYTNLALGTASALMLSLGVAYADSIDPDSYSDVLEVGESVTIDKTVTISAGRPDTAKVDIFFLADETGSMAGEIADVEAAAAAILAGTASLGDVTWGVGGYRDIFDAYVYDEKTDLTAVQADVQTAINSWAASGGGDFAEANLAALEDVATDTMWRDDSTRIIVWFGDAPGHDPRDGSTEVSALAALAAEGVIVHALDAGSLDSTGQATRIADATGGTYGSLGVGTDDVTAAIIAAIDSSFAEYSTVSLDVGPGADCVDVEIAPASIVGDYDRSVERTFEFDVTFTGTSPGGCSFDINALVDGGFVAAESDSFKVTDGGPAPIPLPASFPLLLGALFAGRFISSRRKG